MLLLTATPHQGDASHSRFRHLLKLLDARIDFGGLDNGDQTLWTYAARESGVNGYKPYKDFILRTPKMNVTDAQGKKIFRGRDTHTLRFSMFKDEATFYKEVSKYISAGHPISGGPAGTDGTSVGADKAFEVAKSYLQEQVKESIWDWDEDVSLLNLAAVVVRH
jgi:hypothetical protein